MVHKLIWELTASDHDLQQCCDLTFHEVMIRNVGSIVDIIYFFADKVANINSNSHGHIFILIVESFYCVAITALIFNRLCEELYQRIYDFYIESGGQLFDKEVEKVVKTSLVDFRVYSLFPPE
jgi:hypothetical protein